MPHRKRNSAFTLLEVLVALAVVAIALGAAVHLAGGMLDTANGLKQRTVARWIAQNRINTRIMARNNFPPIGSTAGDETMAGMSFHWEENISNTPNQYYRRIELRVFGDDDPDFALATLIGYLHVTEN